MAAERPVVHLCEGSVRGIATDRGDAFLGVPYGHVRRFAPPRAAAWNGERDASRPGPAAPQPRRPIGTFTHGELPGVDEQCLTLNVWRPRAGGRARPVLVWLHGGGFAVGWGSASLYDGARLAAAAGIVVVSVNYRLGSLGWLHHPGLAPGDDGAPCGNWGLLDQQAALRWVRDNIASFGGDPGQVTLAGQSAGALSAIGQLVAPGAEGLFARAILQSPPLFDAAHPPELGERWAEALAARAAGAGGGGGVAFDLDALRRAPAQRIVELHEELLRDPAWAGTRGGALPILHAATLPAGPGAAALAPPEIDVLVGTTADEGSFFFRAAGRRPEPDEAGLLAMVGHLPGVADPAATVAAYRERAAADGTPTDTNTLLVRIGGDALVTTPTAAWAARRAASGARVHRFRVDHPGPDPDLGAMHTADVPLLFGTYGDGGPGTRLAGDTARAAEVSEAVMAAWGAFVRGEGPGWAPSAVGVFGGDGVAPERTEAQQADQLVR